MLYYFKFSLFLFLIWIVISQQLCTLPPAFWCDNEVVALNCTGSLDYCQSYKKNIEENKNKISFKISYSSLCSDSIAFIFKRLYPTILASSQALSQFDFEAVAWGVTKRLENKKIQCQHGKKECEYNTLLSCSDNKIKDNYKRVKFFLCAMKYVVQYSKVSDIIKKCGTSKKIMSKYEGKKIKFCVKGSIGKNLQKKAENKTTKIINPPVFIPQILIGDNDKTMDMQIYQLLLKEKPQMWKKQLENIQSGGKKINNCTTPPDFWCSTEKLSSDCINNEMCIGYISTIQDKKIDFVMLYDPEEPVTQRMLSESFQKTFLENNAYYIKKTYNFELKPKWNDRSRDECTKKVSKGCRNIAVYSCISKHLLDQRISTDLQICLMKAKLKKKVYAFDALKKDCKEKYKSIDQKIKKNIENCIKGNDFNSSINEYTKYIDKLTPDKVTKEPWLLINNFSLNSTQEYIPVLDKMVCTWYYGYNHDRDFCGRCQYEESRC
uniref:Gamma-interferon-inducible lysosomal thiol reductase (inferred by orthology to a human protein) n=1 Tax=Strongyloides venezuelensis TaxID=75913 RepID=A0A0K0FBN8_STRVS